MPLEGFGMPKTICLSSSSSLKLSASFVSATQPDCSYLIPTVTTERKVYVPTLQMTPLRVGVVKSLMKKVLQAEREHQNHFWKPGSNKIKHKEAAGLEAAWFSTNKWGVQIAKGMLIRL